MIKQKYVRIMSLYRGKQEEIEDYGKMYVRTYKRKENEIKMNKKYVRTYKRLEVSKS